MLAATLRPDDFGEVTDPRWVMERKWDGYRLLVTTGPDGPAAFSREGNKRALPANLQAVFGPVENVATFDGEYAQGVFHLFDMPHLEGFVTPDLPWARRHLRMRKVLDAWSPPDEVIRVVDHVREGEAKLDLLRLVQEEGGEGVVFKLLDAPYRPGRSSSWRKHKFVLHVDCVVIDTGHEGKNNLVLAMADPAGDLLIPGGRGREVGRCSSQTGDGRHQVISVGDVVTVTVTGLGASGRLVEPVKPRVRADKPAEMCTIDQLDDLRGISR